MIEDHFRLGLSSITAVAELADPPYYPHVMKATLQHNVFHRFVSAHLSWLPVFVQRFIKRVWPRYTLPDCVILKKLRKPEHTWLFENEQTMYQRLAAAQGDLIPHYYGEANCEGDRTCVFSFFPYPTVMYQPLPRLTPEVFHDRISVAIQELFRCGGVICGDTKPENIMIADDGRIVFIDLEFMEEPKPEKRELSLKVSVMAFDGLYKHFLKAMQDEETIFPNAVRDEGTIFPPRR